MKASERLRELGVPIGQAMHADEYAEALTDDNVLIEKNGQRRCKICREDYFKRRALEGDTK